MEGHVHVGIEHLLVTSAEIIIFLFFWRIIMCWARRRGYKSLAGAMAFIV